VDVRILNWVRAAREQQQKTFGGGHSPIDLQENELRPVCIIRGDSDRRRTGALKGKQPFGKYLELEHDSAAFLCSRDLLRLS